jgi:hypothetical protein
MPKIIIRADTPGHEAPLITLSERLVAENLESGHYAAQLVERITWATQDAEALEAHEGDGTVRTPTPADSESWTQPATSENRGLAISLSQ